ncbi:MAG TPA: tetratricopeptide repeat protein [Candidatus Methylomirabilis sp.]|jgi:tetratricopeptide (TPR) repeat protein
MSDNGHGPRQPAAPPPVPAWAALRAAILVAIALGTLHLLWWFASGGDIFGLFSGLIFVGWWCFLLYFASWGRRWAFAGIIFLAGLELAIFVYGGITSARAGARAGELAAQGVFLCVDAVILRLGLRALGQARRVAGAVAGLALVLAALAPAAEAAAPRATYDVRPRALGRSVGSLALANPGRTVEALERQVAQNPQAPEPLLELARIFVERAAEIGEIQNIPYYHRNTGELAGQIRGEDPLQRAAGYVDRAAGLRKECPECDVLRARILLARGRAAEARDRLQQWTLRNAETAEALTALAAALEVLGDRFGAEGLARRALFLDPGMAPAHLLVGRMLLERKAAGEAREAFERAQRAAHPWQQRVRVEAAVGVGRALADEGQVPQAEEVLHAALRQAPDQVALYEELGKLLVAARRYPDAVQINLERLRWRKYDPDAYVHLYEIFEATADWPGAERLFASIVERDADDATAHYYLGLARRDLHKAEPARQEFQRALALAGEGSQVHRLARRQLSR